MTSAIVGESTANVNMTIISTLTTRQSTNVTSIWVDDVVVHLPIDIASIMNSSYLRPSQLTNSLSIDFGSDCYDSAIALYKKNPYLVSSSLSTSVSVTTSVYFRRCYASVCCLKNLELHYTDELFPKLCELKSCLQNCQMPAQVWHDHT